MVDDEPPEDEQIDVAEGPAGAALEARIGNAPGASFQVKAPQSMYVAERHGRALSGTFQAGWRRMAVKSGAGTDVAFFELEPADQDNRIERDGFYLRGRFRVVLAIVGRPQRAGEAFSAFRPE
jgi:hypothetical protein